MGTYKSRIKVSPSTRSELFQGSISVAVPLHLLCSVSFTVSGYESRLNPVNTQRRYNVFRQCYYDGVGLLGSNFYPSVAVLRCLYAGYCNYAVVSIIGFSSSLLLSMPREQCVYHVFAVSYTLHKLYGNAIDIIYGSEKTALCLKSCFLSSCKLQSRN